jgi:hypothetical protein
MLIIFSDTCVSNNFRKLALEQIAANSGIASKVNTAGPAVKPEILKESGVLTDMVRKHLGVKEAPVSNFREKFLALPPGPAREQLVFNAVVARKPFAKMIPITIPGPNGTKITYNVMPDYITIDGLRVPMAGQTAQKVADHFGMNLPTSKMSDQIWQAADTKIRPPPLSGGGHIGGKYYSGKEVVENKINTSDSAIAYSDMIEGALQGNKKPGLVAGHMKDIIAPEGDPNKLGLYGWHGTSGQPIQKSPQTGHDTSVHTEYGAGVRLVDSKVTVTLPDGRKITTTMDKLLNHPDMSRSVARTRGAKKYKV